VDRPSIFNFCEPRIWESIMRRITITAAALSVFLPHLVSAQTWMAPGPYAGRPGVYGPPVPLAPWSMPEKGDRDQPAFPYAAPGMPAPPPGFESAPWPSTPDFGRLEQRERPSWPRLTLSRRATDDAYLIEIQLQDLKPDQVEIRPVGRGLVITHDALVRSTQSEPLPGGEGYQSRYSLSRDTSTRRLSLPPDADLAGMTREVKDGGILIRVPRVADVWRGGRW